MEDGTQLVKESSSATLSSWPEGFLDQHGLESPGYQYGPSVVLVDDDSHEPYLFMVYCSPGGDGSWDYIRSSKSYDGVTWTTPTVLLSPQTAFESSSVCDPSIVKFNGVWFLYHTCINVDSPPDGYTNNRVCVAVADAVDGPYHSPTNNVVVEDLNCTKNPKKNYCLGQPSALLSPDGRSVMLYVTDGPIYLATSTDGLAFTWANSRQPVYPVRDVDVKYDRVQGRFLLVQADVGFHQITYATSRDGVNFTAYAPSQRTVVANPELPTGGNNNNPGLVGADDGSIGGMTAVLYGSSTVPVGWGHWKLYASRAMLDATASNCSACLGGGGVTTCDMACTAVLGQPAMGRCDFPGSTNSTQCCSCEVKPARPSCAACAPGGCVAACLAAGYRSGVCAIPGSTNASACCGCQP